MLAGLDCFTDAAVDSLMIASVGYNTVRHSSVYRFSECAAMFKFITLSQFVSKKSLCILTASASSFLDPVEPFYIFKGVVHVLGAFF